MTDTDIYVKERNILPEQHTILVVDDDPDFLNIIRDMLEQEGYRVIVAANGSEALESFKANQPSMVLLDIGLPDMNGYLVCKHIRRSSAIPVIMVSGRDKTEEKVIGLDAGADDYITKPVLSDELTARMRAVFRRTRAEVNRAQPSSFQSKDLKIDYDNRMVTIGSQDTRLTSTEFEILSYLAQHSNQPVPATKILTEIWGEEFSHDTHLLQVNIGRLRQKLNDTDEPKYIVTRSGVGYIFYT